MQALRHACRRAVHASVVQETLAASVKAYSSEAASTVAARKTKQDRSELAKQFVAKFRAANDGQLPGITLLRKEVGGKYETLKKVLQEFAKSQGEPDTPKQTVEIKDAEEKSRELAAAKKDGMRNTARLKEDSKKDKKEVLQVSKGSKAVKSADTARSRTNSKASQAVMAGKDSSKFMMDNGLITDEDDDDSDVAAPEYPQSPLIQITRHKVEEDLKAAKGKEKAMENSSVELLKKPTDGLAIKSKHVDIKQREAEIKQPDVKVGGIRIELPHKARGGDAVHQTSDGSLGFWSKYHGPVPLTRVARIVNLPLHVSASSLKAMCETVARVHKVELRSRSIADVEFDVDLEEMSDVLNRLTKMQLGSSKARVFSAHRFPCGKNGDSKFKPLNAHHYKQVRNILYSSLEQRFRYVKCQIQDYRELQEMKLAR